MRTPITIKSDGRYPKRS